MNKSIVTLVSIITITISMPVLAATKYEFINVAEKFNGTIYDISDSNKILLLDNNFNPSIFDGFKITNVNTGISPVYINDSGQLAGFYNGTAVPHIGFWDGKDSFDLTPDADRRNDILDINNNGFVVGFSKIGTYQAHATLWNANNGTSTDLGALPKSWNSLAFAINDKNQVVGESESKHSDGGIEIHAVLWQNGNIIDLGGYHGENNSRAIDINNNGLVLGYSNNNGSAPDNQIIWDINNSNITLISGAQNAKSINDNGDVVGSANGGFAFLWNNGNMIDLNTLIDPKYTAAGWKLFNASDINNSGWIVGDAKNTFTGERTQFLLNPVAQVPEPSTYLMLLAGLGLLGFVGRRKIN